MSRQLVAVTCDRANVAPWIASQHKPCLLRFVVFSSERDSVWSVLLHCLRTEKGSREPLLPPVLIQSLDDA